MMRWILFFAVFLYGTVSVAQDKVRVDIGELANLTSANPCNVTAWWNDSLLDNMRRRLEVSLGQAKGIDVVDAERLRSYRPSLDSQVTTVYKNRMAKNSQFSVRPTLQTFNLCQVTMNNQTSMKASVAIQINILDTSDGKTVDSFVAESSAEDMINGAKLDLKGVSLGSGLFKDSAVGKAMTVALANASDGIVKRLPASAAPASDVNVQLIRKNTP